MRTLFLIGLLTLGLARAQDEHVPASELPRVNALKDWSSELRKSTGLLARLAGVETFSPATTGTLNLGVVLVEFPDQARPESFSDPQHWADALFSKGTYRKTATGEAAFGSLRDFYLENSGGALDITGKVFDWVQLPTTRASLAEQVLVTPGARTKLFSAALDALFEREGSDALEDCDALIFVCAGPSRLEGSKVPRGSILWPHSTLFLHRGKPWRYYQIESGLKWFEPIGVHCHELGHVLGIYDKYGVGAGTGMGQWCLMASGAHGPRRGTPLDKELLPPEQTLRRLAEEQLKEGQAWLRRIFGGRAPDAPADLLVPQAPDRPRTGTDMPFHFCGVCKVRLGWSKPITVDPRPGHRTYLTPVEDDPNQVVRVLLDPKGRESLYLEYRAARGFDARLKKGGLVVWRVGSPGAFMRTFVALEAVELIPAHGLKTTDAALRDPTAIPFPWKDTNSVTVRGKRSRSWAVTLSGIEERDGRLYLEIAAE